MRRIDDQLAAGEPLADVIVGVAFELERHAARQERAETLPGRSGECEADGPRLQALGPVLARDLARQHRPHRAIHVANRQLEFDRSAVLDRLACMIDQLRVQRLFQAVILRNGAAPLHAARNLRVVQHLRKIQAARLPMLHAGAHFDHVHAPDHLLHPPEPHASPSIWRTCSAMKKKKLITFSGVP